MKTKFSDRLAYLRMLKGISARGMSLSLGQNFTYINNIENKKNLPSMEMFFNICEFLEVTPQEFFDEGNIHPEYLGKVIGDLKKLNEYSLTSVSKVIDIIANK